MQIKGVTHVRNIYPQEHEVNIDGRKKALVQSLKQFHASFYQLYEKGMTHTITQVMLSGALASLPVLASNHSVPGVSNRVETRRWSPSTSV